MEQNVCKYTAIYSYCLILFASLTVIKIQQAKLNKFYLEHGHTNVDQRDDMALYQWCLGHKHHVKERKAITTQRRNLLQSIGFDLGD